MFVNEKENFQRKEKIRVNKINGIIMETIKVVIALCNLTSTTAWTVFVKEAFLPLTFINYVSCRSDSKLESFSWVITSEIFINSLNLIVFNPNSTFAQNKLNNSEAEATFFHDYRKL